MAKKIIGLKSAVGDYKRANADGWYSPFYGYLMFDSSSGELWTDEFYSIGHNSWKVYQSDSIVNLGDMMREEGIEVNMVNVRAFIEANFPDFAPDSQFTTKKLQGAS